MINKTARIRLFSFVRSMANMDVKDIPDNLSDRFSAAIVYLMALQDAGLVSAVIYNRLMMVITNVYQIKNREFFKDLEEKEKVETV